MTAFSGQPWYEQVNPRTATQYLASFRSGQVAWAFYDHPRSLPYLYLHGRVYTDKTALLNDEFSGSQAFYIATDQSVVERALNGYRNIFFVSSIHADKTVALADHYKPRLKILPGLIDDLLQHSGCQAIAYFTHPATAVANYDTRHAGMQKFKIEHTSYRVQPRPEGNEITHLSLFVISRPA